MMHVYIDTRGAPVRAVQRAARTEAPRLRDFVAASRRHKVGELRERRADRAWQRPRSGASARHGVCRNSWPSRCRLALHILAKA